MFCQPTDNNENGHYDCDQVTGTRLCHKGRYLNCTIVYIFMATLHIQQAGSKVSQYFHTALNDFMMIIILLFPLMKIVSTIKYRQ